MVPTVGRREGGARRSPSTATPHGYSTLNMTPIKHAWLCLQVITTGPEWNQYMGNEAVSQSLCIGLLECWLYFKGETVP